MTCCHAVSPTATPRAADAPARNQGGVRWIWLRIIFAGFLAGNSMTWALAVNVSSATEQERFFLHVGLLGATLAVGLLVGSRLLLDSLLAGDWRALGIAARHLFLPAVTLGLYPAAVVSATLEARISENRVERLVIALRSRGLSPVRIWGWHVLRLLSGPVVTVIGTQTGALLGGAVLTETVYSWPGMGRFLVDGVLNRDLFVIQHGLLLIVVLALLVVTAADLLAARLNRHEPMPEGQS